MNTICVVQARMGSTRLPGKVLADLGGRPSLALLLERLRHGRVGAVVVATSDLPADGPVADLADGLGVPVVRGSEEDVLGRYALAVASYRPDHVVRITADCPLIDPALVREAVSRHLDLAADYTSNTLARTFPDGLDVEVMRASALETAAAEAVDTDEREHVTPFLYRRPERFRLATLCSEENLGEERWTVDTADDLARLRDVVDALDDPVTASWRDVLAVAGRTTTPRSGRLWLRPVCWVDVDFRRAWEAILDGDVVGSVAAELLEPAIGRLHFDGQPDARADALARATDALRADKQITTLID